MVEAPEGCRGLSGGRSWTGVEGCVNVVWAASSQCCAVSSISGLKDVVRFSPSIVVVEVRCSDI